MNGPEQKVFSPWWFLAMAVLSSFIPFIHISALNEAILACRSPSGLHPTELLVLRDIAIVGTASVGALALLFCCSWRFPSLTKPHVVKVAFLLTLILWIVYGSWCAVSMLLQLTMYR
jgi:hypothetical protein